jgi:PIN domain nuclease of toxin-antitoxin system
LALHLLLDTHVVVRWLSEPKKLSHEQTRVLRESVRRGEPVALSAISLLEIANLFTRGMPRIEARSDELFDELNGNPLIQVLPLTVEIAREVPSLVGLPDPADRAIVATVRVHGLRLLTSDQRIIEANLVPVID